MKENQNDPRIRVEEYAHHYGLWNHLTSYYYSVEVLINGRWKQVDWGFLSESEAYEAGARYLAEKGGSR